MARGGDSARFKELGKKIRDQDRNVRKKAALALGKIGLELRVSVNDLVHALQDQDEGVRAQAAQSLGDIGPSAYFAVPALAKVLQDKSAKVRAAAAEALAQIGVLAKAAVPALIKAMNDKDVVVRRRVTNALGLIGPRAKAAIPALIKALKDPDKGVKFKEASVSQCAMIALGNIGPDAKAAASALLEILNTDDDKFPAAIATLAKIKPKDKKLVPFYRQVLQDKEHPRLHYAAVYGLGILGPIAKEAIPDLLEAFRAKGVKGARQIERLQTGVVWALGRMGPAKKVVSTLGNVLKNPKLAFGVRLEAAQALRAMGPAAKGAVPAVTAALTDAGAHIRSEAKKTLRALQGKK
jgi:HEAT repeat protein